MLLLLMGIFTLLGNFKLSIPLSIPLGMQANFKVLDPILNRVLVHAWPLIKALIITYTIAIRLNR
jgi:hypothetical protein